MRWVSWQGKEPPASFSDEDGLFCPRGEEKSSQVIRGKHSPGRTVNTCSSPIFKIDVFMVYGSVQLHKLSAVFRHIFRTTTHEPSVFIPVHAFSHFNHMPLLALVVVAEAPLGCMCIQDVGVQVLGQCFIPCCCDNPLF